MTKLTSQSAYRRGCTQGIRVVSGAMYWRDGRPEVTDAEIRADAIDTFAVMLTPAFTELKSGYPAVYARNDLDQLISEYTRGFKAARQAAIEADAANREIDQSYLAAERPSQAEKDASLHANIKCASPSSVTAASDG